MFRFTKLVAVLGLTFASLFSAPSNAVAATLAYSISGTGSGTLGGVSFTDTAFSFTLSGETANLSGNLLDPLDSASFSIDGVGSGSFQIDTRLGVSAGGVVFFSRAGTGALDLFNFWSNLPVDLASDFSVGMIGNATALDQFNDVATTAGALGFDSASNITFASEVIQLSEVPLPAAAWMLIAGLGGLVLASRKRV